MNATSLVLLLGLGVAGGPHGGAPGVVQSTCGACGGEVAKIAEQITRLTACPDWRERDDAAHALRRWEPACHPEAVLALCAALGRDPRREVRVEAAQSLKHMSPGLPEAHAALHDAATRDGDWAVRFWARCGAKALDDGCRSACRLCDSDPRRVGRGLPLGPLFPSPPESLSLDPGNPLESTPVPAGPGWPSDPMLPPSELAPPLAPSPFVVPDTVERAGPSAERATARMARGDSSDLGDLDSISEPSDRDQDSSPRRARLLERWIPGRRAARAR